GDYGRLSTAVPLLRSSYSERPESASNVDLFDWTWEFVHYWADLDRYETSVSINREDIAYGVSAVMHDLHVGNTLSVEVSYSVVPGAGAHLMREYQRIAREAGVRTIRITKRIHESKYLTRYIKVR